MKVASIVTKKTLISQWKSNRLFRPAAFCGIWSPKLQPSHRLSTLGTEPIPLNSRINDIDASSQVLEPSFLLPALKLREKWFPVYVAPVSEKVQAKVKSPFPTSVQAWLKDFQTNEPIDILNISADVFAAPLRRDLLHRAVVWERDGLRQGTQSAKNRAEVSGTGKKAFPQKGRGKARVGSLRAPQFRGGGRAFPPKPRDHSTDFPHKMFLYALRVLLSTKYSQNQLIIVDQVNLESHKTRELHEILQQHQWHDLMFMVGNCQDGLKRAAKNIPNVAVGDVYDPKIYQMMLRNLLVLDKLSLAYFETLLRAY